MTEAWRLEANRATLRTPELNATLDAANPGAGLQKVSFRGEQIADSLLGVGLHAERLRLVDCFVRAHDLVGRYETEDGGTHLTAYWRYSQPGNGSAAGIDLVASVHTDLLEAFPELGSASVYLGSDASVWRPADGSSSANEPAVIVAGEHGSATELPLDGLHAEPSVQAEAGRQAVSWRLAAGFLEKGVIRRAVLRCRLQREASRPRDAQVAAWLEELRAPGPPLSA